MQVPLPRSCCLALFVPSSIHPQPKLFHSTCRVGGRRRKTDTLGCPPRSVRRPPVWTAIPPLRGTFETSGETRTGEVAPIGHWPISFGLGVWVERVSSQCDLSHLLPRSVFVSPSHAGSSSLGWVSYRELYRRIEPALPPTCACCSLCVRAARLVGSGLGSLRSSSGLVLVRATGHR